MVAFSILKNGNRDRSGDIRMITMKAVYGKTDQAGTDPVAYGGRAFI